MNFLKILTESILNEAAVEKYISAFKKHDWGYMNSDSESSYSKGRKSERALADVFNSLSDDDKLMAAKYFKDNYPIKDGSQHSKGIKSWDIDKKGIQGFNGYHYFKG